MKQDISLLMAQRQRAELATLRACNDLSARYGLSLSDAQIGRLMEKRRASLTETGRVEFGEGMLQKLVFAFCDSPYMQQDEYETTLWELLEAFYYFKNEALDLVSDDELIEFMRADFDRHEGSVEYLLGTSLEALCHFKRFGEEYEDA